MSNTLTAFEKEIKADWVVFKCHANWNGRGDFEAGVIREATTKCNLTEDEIRAALKRVVGTYITL